MVDKPAPWVDKPVPGLDKSTPGADKPAPRVDKPGPGVDKPAPGVDKPAPGWISQRRAAKKKVRRERRYQRENDFASDKRILSLIKVSSTDE